MKVVVQDRCSRQDLVKCSVGGLAQTPGFTLRLEEAEDVVLADWRSITRVSKCIRACLNSWRALPGPLTLRMIDRVWSSINSTRTCVTPPREPVPPHQSAVGIQNLEGLRLRTSTAQNSGHLDQFDGLLGGIHCEEMLNVEELDSRLTEIMLGLALVVVVHET